MNAPFWNGGMDIPTYIGGKYDIFDSVLSMYNALLSLGTGMGILLRSVPSKFRLW